MCLNRPCTVLYWTYCTLPAIGQIRVLKDIGFGVQSLSYQPSLKRFISASNSYFPRRQKTGFFTTRKKSKFVPAGSMILRTPLQNIQGYLATAQAWKVAAAARHVIEYMMFFWLSHRRGKEELLRKTLRPLPDVT